MTNAPQERGLFWRRSGQADDHPPSEPTVHTRAADELHGIKKSVTCTRCATVRDPPAGSAALISESSRSSWGNKLDHNRRAIRPSLRHDASVRKPVARFCRSPARSPRSQRERAGEKRPADGQPDPSVNGEMSSPAMEVGSRMISSGRQGAAWPAKPMPTSEPRPDEGNECDRALNDGGDGGNVARCGTTSAPTWSSSTIAAEPALAPSARARTPRNGSPEREEERPVGNLTWFTLPGRPPISPLQEQGGF